MNIEVVASCDLERQSLVVFRAINILLLLQTHRHLAEGLDKLGVSLGI